MSNKNASHFDQKTDWRYGKPAIVLHWLLALLITFLVGLGWYMMAIEDQPNSGWYFNLHKSFGLIAFGLILARIIWRLGHKPAALPERLPAWQVKISTLTHWLLYAAMFVMPITGFIGASLGKDGVAFFGADLPRWLNQNSNLAEQFIYIHENAAWVLVALVVVHAMAGLKHLLIDKDGVFQRMWY